MKVLYKENYRPLKKEIIEDTGRWKNILSLLIGRIKIVQMPILLNTKVIEILLIPVTKKNSIKCVEMPEASLSRKSSWTINTLPEFKVNYGNMATKQHEIVTKDTLRDKNRRSRNKYIQLHPCNTERAIKIW